MTGTPAAAVSTPETSRPGRRTVVTVAGTGSIGRTVAEAVTRGDLPGCTLLTVIDSSTPKDEVRQAVAASDVLVEATTVEAARHLVPTALALGTDVVVCSCGILAEPGALTLPDPDRDAVPNPPASTGTAAPSRPRQGRVLLPAGAIGGFDVLAAAARAGLGRAHVRHTTTKRPAALGVDHDVLHPLEVFRGTAREAARRYPRTSNSSVALALATTGLDEVEVVVIADPAATVTRHEVVCTSSLGTYRLAFENAVDPASGGRTSAITAWSVVDLLAGLHRGVGPGVVVLDGVS
ncbi:aspartate dehydrogenase domain-containing protein [Kineosporia succinea]|uniref:Aspartate dehydrogenase n=1 Tax=Kineosporia succinea TaxID=84632 RepID=A0ABT9P9A6_9ACTN|nr:aspartate dehydrogenase domain-containing protein [Kineosporia succinea]MDP9829285.1 aspartate dehydrogenase [Kineosporia succinea]